MPKLDMQITTSNLSGADDDVRVMDRPTIVIIGARGLVNADWSLSGNDKSDPYAICTIPGKHDFQIRTRTIDNALDPVWNHEAVMENWEPGDPLVFTVYDKDFGKRDDVLGTATLLSSEFDRDGYDGEVRLRETGEAARSFLKVRICFGKPVWSIETTQHAAMANATFTKTAVTSVRARIRNKRLGVDNTDAGVTRKQFREFIHSERDRNHYCATLPFTIFLWIVFSALAWGQGNVDSVHRLRSGIQSTIEEIRVPQYLPDGTLGHALMLRNVSSQDEMWAWIGSGFLPKLGAHANTSRAGFVNGFNKLIGQVQLRQRRASLDLCHGPEVATNTLAGFARLGCRSLGVASTMSSYGPAVGLAGNATADPSFVRGGALPIGLAERTFGLDDYYYAFLDVMLPSIGMQRAQYLHTSSWCDDATEWVEATAAFFNGEVSAYTHVAVRFSFQTGGTLEVTLDVRPLHTPVWSNSMIALCCIWGLLVVVLLLVTIQEVVDRKGKGVCVRFCGDPWMQLDWLGIIVGILLVAGFVLLLQAMDLITPRIQELQELVAEEPPAADAPFPVQEAYRIKARASELALSVVMEGLRMSVEYKAMHRIAMFAYTFFLLLRFFRGFLGQPAMASIARTLHSASQDVIHFAFMLLIAFENFTLGGLLLFGSEVQTWSSVHAAHISSLMMLAGLGDFAPLYEVYPISAMVWLFTFAVALIFIGSNMLLAILTDHFAEVRKASGLSGLTIFDQAWALIGDGVWTGSYHIRHLVLLLNDRVPRLRKVLPYFDEEGKRISKIPYDELLEVLKPPSEEERKKADGHVPMHLWARGIPDWAPMQRDILLAFGCDESTASRLLAKAEAQRADSVEFPTDVLYHEFEGQMRNMYDQLNGMDEDLRTWLRNRCVDCDNMQPRQRKLESLAVQKIQTRTSPETMLGAVAQAQLMAPPGQPMAALEEGPEQSEQPSPQAQGPRSYGPDIIVDVNR